MEKKLSISEKVLGQVMNILNSLPRGQVNEVASELEREIIAEIQNKKEKDADKSRQRN